MNDEPFEVILDSVNVFADFGHSNATVEQLKALLAAEIIGVLDDRALTVRKAEDLTGTSPPTFRASARRSSAASPLTGL